MRELAVFDRRNVLEKKKEGMCSGNEYPHLGVLRFLRYPGIFCICPRLHGFTQMRQ